MFLDILKFRMKNIYIYLGKLFLKVTSEIHKKKLVLSLKTAKDYEWFYGFYLLVVFRFLVFSFFLKVVLWTHRLFKASALWADAFYKSKCPSVRVSVCVSVHF